MKKFNLKKNIWNILFFGFLVIFLISTPVKSWVFRQALKTGLFSPKIEVKQDQKDLTSPMPLTFTDNEGLFHSTENMKGKNVFINFWASWCPPCIAEMPSINEMYLNLKPNPNVEFVFINLDDQPEKGKDFLKKHQLDIPFQRPEGVIPTDLFSGTLPTTVILNKEGNIIFTHSGMADYNSKGFKNKLVTLQ